MSCLAAYKSCKPKSLIMTLVWCMMCENIILIFRYNFFTFCIFKKPWRVKHSRFWVSALNGIATMEAVLSTIANYIISWTHKFIAFANLHTDQLNAVQMYTNPGWPLDWSCADLFCWKYKHQKKLPQDCES